MKVPKVQVYDGSLQVVDTFGGLNRAEKIREGEWNETLNLSSDHYPLLSTRKKRSLVKQFNGYVLAMLAKEKLAVLTTQYESYPQQTYTLKLLYGDEEVAEFTAPKEKLPRNMISFGAYIIIPKINVWYNTADGTHGSIDAEMESPVEDITESGMTYSYVLKLCPCESEGTELRIVEEIPENQQEAWEESTTFAHDGECFAVGTKRLIRQRHGDNSSMWWETKDLFLRVEADGIDDGINVGDVINLSGIPTAWVNGSGVYREDRQPSDIEPTSQPYFNVSSRYADDPNGLREVVYVGSGFIVVKDVYFPYRVTVSETGADGIVSERRMPDMDFVVEAQNRLWGCKYGIVDGEMINEIYASALGDFKNWRKYDGTSMASWAASVGTDGDWTGAITYQGKPLFFKEKNVHKVYPSAYGAHQIADAKITGVQSGCEHSLVEMDGLVYYMSRDGICAYDGSYPKIISDPIGDTLCDRAFFGVWKRKLYALVTFKQENNHASYLTELYVYNLKYGTWQKETYAVPYGIGDAAEFDFLGESFYICNKMAGYPTEEENTKLWDANGYDGQKETAVSWSCTSGLIGYETVEQKEFYRMDLRMELENNATFKLEIEYDSDGTWHEQATQSGTGIGSVVIPVRPWRCDHFRIRLSGTGQMKLWSIAKRYRRGSDVT